MKNIELRVKRIRADGGKPGILEVLEQFAFKMGASMGDVATIILSGGLHNEWSEFRRSARGE